ncbi:hypothetical protein O181_000180 [Austropuccinia psidii MF-1]|uniref:Uncharacterized protein n=1 Tax=Austropuccinia psidii MF-1 TaxID=1389203 RepID=A0A9Q3GAL8_9BASI|nr:hypothetical protein [Austropuccinia psidii MF-1]
MSFSLKVHPNLTGQRNVVIHFNNFCYSFNLWLPSGPFFNFYTVSNSIIHPSLYNTLQNPPPNNNNEPNSPKVISTNYNDNFSSSAMTIPNFPVYLTLNYDPIASIFLFSNMFSNSNALSPSQFAPKTPATFSAMPSWVKYKIPTLP